MTVLVLSLLNLTQTISDIHTYEELFYSSGPGTNIEPPLVTPDRLPETVTSDNDDDDYI